MVALSSDFCISIDMLDSGGGLRIDMHAGTSQVSMDSSFTLHLSALDQPFLDLDTSSTQWVSQLLCLKTFCTLELLVLLIHELALCLFWKHLGGWLTTACCKKKSARNRPSIFHVIMVYEKISPAKKCKFPAKMELHWSRCSI